MHKEKITNFIKSDEYIPMSSSQIAELLCVPQKDMELFDSIIDELVSEGVIVVGRKKRCFSVEALGLIKGVFRANAKGFGFVTVDGEDIFIAPDSTGGALDGDTVLIKLLNKKAGRSTHSASQPNSKRTNIARDKKSSGKSCEGEVLRVTMRKQRTIVGIFSEYKGYGIVRPDSEKLPKEFFVAPKDYCGALNGQKVVAQITEYESPTTSLCCKITEILGFPYDFGVDVLSVIKSYDFAVDFPKEALNEATNAPDVTDDDLLGREDFSKLLTITIDGDDTKDIDDAISLEKTDNGYRLGVHIADVSHYVMAGSALDNEAYLRGTSVYLADRVIPMLPTRLSNGLCSLNEGVVRLTMSVVMDFDESGEMISSAFYKSYIKSAAKMTYNNVKLILSEHPAELCEKYKDIVPMLEDMYSLAKLLNKQTKKRGSIDFNIPEAKAVFDKNGKTIDIVLRENSFANNIIEEFMVAANSAVAKFLCEKGAPSIFRIHEEPNQERFENALDFIRNAGFDTSKSVQNLMEAVKGTSGETVFSTLLLRSMAKARYESENCGHFGLALEYYCHFTSPIRRYPDLVCHRALKAILENDKATIKRLRTITKDASEQSSERENAAAMCERDTLDIKKAEYMQQFVGESFDGIISSVTGFGFFVMLPNTVEGLVRVEDLRDDYYVFNEKRLTLIGERSGKSFCIGDKIRVKLVSADKISRKIDFIPEKGGNINGTRKRKEKNPRTKQKRSSRVLHRRKTRGRH